MNVPPATLESVARFLEDLRAAHDRKRKNRSPFVMAWYDQAIALIRAADLNQALPLD